VLADVKGLPGTFTQGVGNQGVGAAGPEANEEPGFGAANPLAIEPLDAGDGRAGAA